jgi:hypothetical protein
MNIKKLILNDKGFALLTTFLLSFLSLSLIAVAFYMLTSSSHLQGVAKRYTVELDAAKGVSGYIMAEVRNSNLECVNSPCIPNTACASNNSIIKAPDDICLGLGKVGSDGKGDCSTIKACYMTETEDTALPGTTLYSFEVTSTNNNGEKAIVNFVYRTQ